jgi:hypothetical protein
MRSGKPIGSAKIYGSLEVNAEVSIHKVLTRASDALGQPENGDDEMSANNLGTLLRQVTEVSTREIENLINELHGLRKKLETDGDRIHRPRRIRGTEPRGNATDYNYF